MTKLTVTGGRYGETGEQATVAQAGAVATLEASGGLGFGVARGNLDVTLTQAPCYYSYAPHFAVFNAQVGGISGQNYSFDKWDKMNRSILHESDFGDPGAIYDKANILPEHKDRNKSFTPHNTAHVYRTPGTYTATRTCTDLNGNTGTASTQVVVLDPEDPVTGYQASETYVVAGDGDFTGCPNAIAANKFTDFTAALTQLDIDITAGSTGKYRLMLKGGFTYTWPPARLYIRFREGEHLWIGRWGAGTAPWVIDSPVLNTATESMFTANLGQIKATNGKFTGAWDPIAEIWTSQSQGAPFRVTHYNCELLYDDVVFDRGWTAAGVTSSDEAAAVTGHGKVIINNCLVRDLKDFTTLAQGRGYSVHILGLQMERDPNAHNGTTNRWEVVIPGTQITGDPQEDERNWYPRHSHQGFRATALASVDIDGSYFLAGHGWTFGPGFFDNGPLRLNTGGNPDQNITVSRSCVLGVAVLGDSSGSSLIMEAATNVTIQMSVLALNPTLTHIFGFGGSGVSLLSNLFIAPDRVAGFQLNLLVDLSDGQYMDEQSSAYPIVLNGNTEIVELRDSLVGTFGRMGQTSKLNNTVINNGALCTFKGIDDGPWTIEEKTPRFVYTGVSRGWEETSVTLTADVVSGASILIPYWNDHYGNPLTQASFAGQDGRHAVGNTVGGTVTNWVYVGNGTGSNGSGMPDDFNVSFDATGVTITNHSGVTWPNASALSVHVSRGTTGMAKDPAWAYNVPVKLYRPAAGSPLYQSADPATVWPVDLLGNYRPGTNHPNAPAGLPSKGAIEPL